MSKVHIVEQGECLTSIAATYGFADITPILDAPQNEAFRKLRPSPDVILPGDGIFIPDVKPLVLTLETGKRHKIIVKLPRRKVRVKLEVPDERSLAGQAFELSVGAAIVRGQVGPENFVEAEVPAKANVGTLAFPDLHFEMQVAIGHLDPLRDGPGGEPLPAGVQARLHNLGFLDGRPSGVIDDDTKAAIAKFQRLILRREDADGELDDETLTTLSHHHGC